MKLQLKAGTTSQPLYLFIQDSSVTTGAGKTGLAFNAASLVAYYVRPLGSATAITLVTQTVTGAYSSGGFVEIDAVNMPGLYRFDVPDAALAAGKTGVVVMLKGAANMAPVVLEIELVAYDPQDAVRAGLTALPNAAAEAAGGLYTRGTGAGQINQPANGQIDANTVKLSGTAQTARDIGASVLLSSLESPVLHSGTAQAGAAGTITLAAGASATDSLYVGNVVKIYGGTGVGQARTITAYNGTTKVATVDRNWVTNPDATSTYAVLAADNPDLDASLQIARVTLTDTLTTYTGDTPQSGDAFARLGAPAGVSTAADIAAVKSDSGAIKAKTDSLTFTGAGKVDASVRDWLGTAPATPNTAGVPIVDPRFVARVATAQAGAAGTITLDASASATTDFYKEQIIHVISGTGAGQSRICTAYNGTTKVATISPNWATNPDVTSVFEVIAIGPSDVEAWLGAVAPANTGDAFARIGSAGAGLTSLGDTRITNLDATVSSRSTYAGGAVASVTAAVTVGTNNDKSGYSLAALDSMTLHSGTLQSGGTGAVTLAAGASATDNLYQYCLLKIYAGAGAGQTAYITSYVGSTKVTTLFPVLQLLTDATSQYAVIAVNGRNGNIIGNMNGDLNGNINGGLSGSVQGNVIGSVQGNVNGNVGGSVASVGTGGITSASFAAGAISSTVVNADLDTYQVDFDFKQSSVAVLDRYEVVFKKNGETLSSGVTVPTIQVIKEADGTNLVASVAMTQIGTSGTYKYEEGVNRAVAGSSYIAIITATIGGLARTFKKPFGLTN